MAAWSLFTTYAGFCGVLALFFGACLHVSAQFNVLSARLENSDEGPSLKLSEEQNKEVQEKLMEIVKQHEALIKLCELMTQSFSWIILFHFISSAIQISACILLLFFIDGIEWLQFLIAILCFLIEAFIFAYAGQAIINSSTGLQHAAYNFEWYKCDARNRKMILLIMIRSQKKICMKAPFFEVSLESFLKVRYETMCNYIYDKVSPSDCASCVFLHHILKELHVNLSSYQLLVNISEIAVLLDASIDTFHE